MAFPFASRDSRFRRDAALHPTPHYTHLRTPFAPFLSHTRASPLAQVPLPFFLRSPSCLGLGTAACLADDDCGAGAVCNLGDAPSLNQSAALGVCVASNAGGGCGGLGWDRVLAGAILGGYIIVYGQMQSWTPQLVTTPLGQTPPNKLTEVLWGLINCLPTAWMAIVAWLASNAAGACLRIAS